MEIITEKQIIDEARFEHSDNSASRPPNEEIEICVLHNYERIAQAQKEHANPSIHIAIQGDGLLVQYIPFSKKALHCGRSKFHGRSNCDDFSIGIALQGDVQLGYSDSQYRQLALLLKLLIKNYSRINLERIVSHSDIAAIETTGPGPHFDWARLHDLIISNKEVS